MDLYWCLTKQRFRKIRTLSDFLQFAKIVVGFVKGMARDRSPLSPTATPIASNADVSSPQWGQRSLPSTCASVIRGDSDEVSSPIAGAASIGSSVYPQPEQSSASHNSQLESSDVNGDSNAGRPGSTAWNRPLDEVDEVGSVMGGSVCWPALSELTRPISRSDSSKPASNDHVSSPLSGQRSLPSTCAAAAASIVSSVSPAPEQTSASHKSVIENSGSNEDVSNADRPGSIAWNRPLDRVVEVGSVMGGSVSWPALSELTRPVSRSDSSKPVSDGSVSSSQAPIISQPPRQSNTSTQANSTANNSMHTRPSTRHCGGWSSSRNGPSHNYFNRPPPPMPPPFLAFGVPNGMAPAMLNTPLRPVGGVGGSQSHTGNGYYSQRNTSRRSDWPRPRGDGSFHNDHGGRLNQDRRDAHLPQQYMPPPHMGYMPFPLPPGATPFMATAPVRAFPGQMDFDMTFPFTYVPTLPLEFYWAMPIIPPQPTMVLPPANENSLTNMIVNQIDYYFSDDNLAKDTFLRSNMDDHGWVPITLIASFPRVQHLTKDIPVILESLLHSTTVEVQGGKIRRRKTWNKWLYGEKLLKNVSVS